ncbi:Kinase-like protein [Mycena sanguinolenta]|uniref:Kinase-like protein n=1 Tax=Mycena sanguinolenta TaxID=230812 RepID=A0A8H7DJC7_9AGAR|nr:Kinase-like protein [Mycena sanguinolenta]
MTTNARRKGNVYRDTGMKPVIKEQKASPAIQPLGPFRFPFAQFEKDGIVAETNVPKSRRSNLYFFIASPVRGSFIIVLHFKGRETPVQKGELKLDDLLQMQKESKHLDFESSQLNPAKLIELLQRLFPAQGLATDRQSMLPKILIHESLLSFLRDACNTRLPGRSLSEVAQFKTSLDDYTLSMASNNVVSAIVGSLESRRTLLESASQLGLATDPKLRSAQRTDDERIATILVSIFDSKDEGDMVLRLEGDPAQCFLDVVQETLDKGLLLGEDHSRMARRMIRKLSERCDMLPSSLFITGLYEIAQGLHYLHSSNIIHGDLRGANVLVNEDWSACLADFGLSNFADATSSMTTNRGGSLYWMAPELIDPDRFGLQFARTSATDVYAFGCVCLELYTGRPPFADLREPAALLKIMNKERPQRPVGPPVMSDALWSHVLACWVDDPQARPDTQLVVETIKSFHSLPLLLNPLPPPPSSSVPSSPVYTNGSAYLDPILLSPRTIDQVGDRVEEFEAGLNHGPVLGMPSSPPTPVAAPPALPHINSAPFFQSCQSFMKYAADSPLVGIWEAPQSDEDIDTDRVEMEIRSQKKHGDAPAARVQEGNWKKILRFGTTLLERDKGKEKGRSKFPSTNNSSRTNGGGPDDKDNDKNEENELIRKISFLTATGSDDWTLVLDICDHASATKANAMEAMRALCRDFKYGEPAIQLAAGRLWAIMLLNSPKTLFYQCTSDGFLDTVEDVLLSPRTSPLVRERLLAVLSAAAFASGPLKHMGFHGSWARVRPPDKPDEGEPLGIDTLEALKLLDEPKGESFRSNERAGQTRGEARKQTGRETLEMPADS